MNSKNLRNESNGSILDFKLDVFCESFGLGFDGEGRLARSCVVKGIESKIDDDKVISLEIVVEGIVGLS